MIIKSPSKVGYHSSGAEIAAEAAEFLADPPFRITSQSIHGSISLNTGGDEPVAVELQLHGK